MAAPELRAVLEQLLEPDNAVIQQATARLREAFADPRTPQRLADIVVGAARPQVRQLAAVLLRRRLSGEDGGAWIRNSGSGSHPYWLKLWRRKQTELCLGGLQAGTPPHSISYALKAIGGLAAAVGGTQTDLLRSLLPAVLRALRALIDADEELGADALEVLDELVAADPKAVTSDLRPVLDLCLQVGGADGRGQAVRARALAVLGFLAQERPKALLPFLPALLSSLLSLLCSPPSCCPPDPEDAELWGPGGGGRGQRPPLRRSGAERLALGIPAEKLLREMVPRLEALLGSAAPWGRKGALLALGLRPTAVGSTEKTPEAAALALEALPAALAALPVSLEPLPGSPEVLPGSRDWFVLRELLAVAGAAVAPQAEAILGALLGVLERGRPQEMELALSALHELGGAVEQFPVCPAGGAVEAALLRVLQLPDPHQRSVRLQAMEVLGALGCGPAALGAALEAVLEMAANGEAEERRVLFGLCGATAEALREGAEPMLPKLLPLLLNSLQAPPPAVPSSASDSFLLFDAAEDEEGAEPMDGEEEEHVMVEVGGDFVAEVEAACEGVGLVAEHCGSAFEPYFSPVLEALLPLLEFPHPEVRAAAYGALGGLSCGAGRSMGHRELQGRALAALLGAVRAEKGAGPARAGLTALCKGLSPAPSPQLLHAIGCLMADVINGKVRCLQDGDGSEDDEEEVEATAELRELAGEGLAAVGGASPGGGTLSDAFRQALPTLLGCLSGDVAQRSWAAAILGEAGVHLEEGVAKELLPLIGPALARSSAHDPDPEVRSNALCSIGRLAANGVQLGVAWPGLAAIGRALREEGPGRARDNACGALVRHKGALPDAELLPHAEEMPRVCSTVGMGRMEKDLEAAVVGLLLELWRSCPIEVGRGMERLPHSERERLQRAMGLDDAAAMMPTPDQ
ncbi:importin-4 isoform X2 [Lagopus muta]|uniref:importin-4 isoform X2 n=1 Tax=Lagopus muta TaxID=64668 RepID=UPI0020A02BDB|nr:importin-4 isoform X2 [Lagopus muta]